MNKFVCVNVGRKYSANYVHRLYSMIFRNTTQEFDFYVYTDQPDLYPSLKTIEHTTDEQGWWCKLKLFEKGVLPEGRFVYCDLDVVVVDNVDFLWQGQVDKFQIIRDFIRPDDGLVSAKEFNSSVMSFDTKQTDGIWQLYKNNITYWKQKSSQIHFLGDQNVISQYADHYPEFFEFYDDKKIWSLRKGVERGKHSGDRSRWFGKAIPENGRICVFHGNPSPKEVIETTKMYKEYVNNEDVEWIKENWR